MSTNTRRPVSPKQLWCSVQIVIRVLIGVGATIVLFQISTSTGGSSILNLFPEDKGGSHPFQDANDLTMESVIWWLPESTITTSTRARPSLESKAGRGNRKQTAVLADVDHQRSTAREKKVARNEQQSISSGATATSKRKRTKTSFVGLNASLNVPSNVRRKLYQYHPPRPRGTDEEQDNFAAEKCGEAPKYSKYFQSLGKFKRSSNFEDRTIFNTFFRQLSRDEMRGYRYVELGAYNGKEESNTRFFDACLGWEGILIEPNPVVYPELVHNRPYAHRMSFAASCSVEDERQNKTVGFWGSRWTNAAEDKSINRKAYAKGPQSRLTQVPCGSLTPVILDLFPDGHIHFFSLDTEGVEPSVLENIDFERVQIDVLIVENTNKFCSKVCESRDRARAIMKDAGYLRYTGHVERSDLYVRPNSSHAAKLQVLGLIPEASNATIITQGVYMKKEQVARSGTDDTPETDRIAPHRLKSQTTSREQRSASRAAAAVVASSLENSNSSWISRAERRRNLYQYHPPSVRGTEATQEKFKTDKCGTAPDYSKFFNGLGKFQRSSSSEDRTIFNTFFQHLSMEEMHGFRYIELGAFNGKEESNTRFFDVCLGWDGLLIEPNPVVYPRLVENRPYAHRMSFAASCSVEDESQNKTVGFWGYPWTNAAEDTAVNRKAFLKGSKARLTQVPCGSLTTVILDLFPDGHIHFFSLDTEGVEPLVLENIDFEKVQIDVLIVEKTNKFCMKVCESRDRSRAIMKAAGYLRYTGYVDRSDLYVRPNSWHVAILQKLQVEPAT